VMTTLASYTLPDNVQNLTYSGTGNFTGNGNGLANTTQAASAMTRSSAMEAMTRSSAMEAMTT